MKWKIDCPHSLIFPWDRRDIPLREERVRRYIAGTLRNVDVPDVKNSTGSWYFHSFSALTRQIRTAGPKTMAFRFVVWDGSVPSSEISDFRLLIMTSGTSAFWPGLLEAWLVLTSVKYHGNLYILIPLNQRLALTRLRATGPLLLSSLLMSGGRPNQINSKHSPLPKLIGYAYLA